MRPATLSLLLALVLAPLGAVAGPVITQLRVTLLTGDDAMRGSGDAYLKMWFDGASEGLTTHNLTSGVPVGFRALGNKLNSHSAYTTVRSIDPIDISRISNVGVHFHLPYSTIGHTTFLFNEPDEWHMDGLIVTGITATGEEYTIYNNPAANHRFVRLNLYTDDRWRIDEFKSPRLGLGGTPVTRVDEFRVSVRTGGDNLRPGSRAFFQVKLRNGWRFEHRLTARPVELPDHSAIQQSFRLPRLVEAADIESVALRYEADHHGGSTDEWTVQGFSVEARRALTTTEYFAGRTPHLRTMLAEEYAAETRFATSRSETVFFHTYAATIPEDARLTLMMRTGGDDFRGGSYAHLRVLLNDGGFHETRLNSHGEGWGSNTTTTRTINLPAWIQLRHVRDWGVRFESGRRDWMGDDQWTLDSFSVTWDSSLVAAPGMVFGTGRSPHHFPESATWIPDTGIATEPLTEEQTYTYVTEANVSIPLIQDNPYVMEEPFTFELWNELIKQSLERWSFLLKAATATRFEAYAFGVLPGGRPAIEIRPHSPDPATGDRRFLVRYARLADTTDVTFTLRHASDLRSWSPVPGADVISTITDDPVLPLEWVELIVSGPTVAGPRNFFRIEAGPGTSPPDGGLRPPEIPSLPPTITPPDGLYDDLTNPFAIPETDLLSTEILRSDLLFLR